MTRASLYIHVPFCVRKCGYCDFYSGVAGDADIERYLNALDAELKLRFPHGFSANTVFIGGGTPTRLSAAQLRRLGDILGRRVDLSGCREFTSEINPGTLTPAKAEALTAMGVDRASFGVQSFNPRFLEDLDRAYEAGTATAAVEMARAAGIARISMDLMFALPGQTLADLQDDLKRALGHGTEHLSLYALTYEDDTPLTRQLASGELAPCPEELEREMFHLAGETCASAGLRRYEVSNFAKPGAECLHNLNYWRVGEWAGVGAGAHGYLDSTITANAADFKAYTDALVASPSGPILRKRGRGLSPQLGTVPEVERATGREYGDSPELPEQSPSAFTRNEKLSPMQRGETLLMMGLRLAEGVELKRFRELSGADFLTVCREPALALIDRGLLEITATHVRATNEGLFVLDELILHLADALEVPA